jgi:hypothetical protein
VLNSYISEELPRGEARIEGGFQIRPDLWIATDSLLPSTQAAALTSPQGQAITALSDIYPLCHRVPTDPSLRTGQHVTPRYTDRCNITAETAGYPDNAHCWSKSHRFRIRRERRAGRLGVEASLDSRSDCHARRGICALRFRSCSVSGTSVHRSRLNNKLDCAEKTWGVIWGL